MAAGNKIAFVGKPGGASFLPGAASPSIGSDNVVIEGLSRHVPDGDRALVVTDIRSNLSRKKGTAHHRIDDRADRFLTGSLSRIHSFVPGGVRPHFQSYRNRFFARRAAALCTEEGAGCIVLAACPQWAPLFKNLNPSARLVLLVRNDALCAAPARFVRYLNLIDRFLAPYDALAERLGNRYPSLKDRIRVVPDGVDTQVFRMERMRARQRVLYVGRRSPETGVHVLVGAFLKLKERYPGVELILAGPAGRTPRSRLLGTPTVHRHLLKGGGLRPWRRPFGVAMSKKGFFTVGDVSREDLPRLYGSSTLLVLPSLVDSASGLVLAEAMAAGLPVVASRTGAAVDMVRDGRTGTLVDPGNVEQLASAVRMIFDNRETAAKMGESARKRAWEKYGWDRVAARFLDAVGP